MKVTITGCGRLHLPSGATQAGLRARERVKIKESLIETFLAARERAQELVCSHAAD